jgi:hypothetical protein
MHAETSRAPQLGGPVIINHAGEDQEPTSHAGAILSCDVGVMRSGQEGEEPLPILSSRPTTQGQGRIPANQRTNPKSVLPRHPAAIGHCLDP